MMRQIRSLSMVAFVVVLDGHGQSLLTMPDVGASWNVQHQYLGNFEVQMEHILFDYTPEAGSYVSEGLSWGAVSAASVYGWPDRIAVDSGRVYYKFIGGWDTTAQLLYDFDLQVGDTAYIDWDLQPAIVELADTIPVLERSSRHLILSNGDEWLEFMGSVHGLFRPCCYSYFEDTFDLVYFYGWYTDPDSNEFEIHWPLDLGVIESSFTDSSLYPNPNDGTFSIASPVPSGWFRVTDLRGVEVLAGPLKGSKTTVHLDQPTPGMYVVAINGRRAKLVIQ